MTDRNMDTWSPTPDDLGPYAPASPEEAIAAARAVVDHRHNADEAQCLKLLDPLARDVATAAFAAGRQEVLDELRTLIGTAAVTVEAGGLMEALHRELRGTALDFTPAAETDDDWLQNRAPRWADMRAAAIVARVVRRHRAIVEAAEKGDQVL